MNNFFITLFLGWTGLHKFMDKKIGTGLLYLFTFGLFGIGWLVDIVIAATKINSPQKIHSLKIEVVGESFMKNQIASVMSGNGLYNASDNIFIDKVEETKKIYKFKYRETTAQLVPEPDNPHDSNAIKVVIDNVHVGYIPASRCLELKNILGKIKYVNAHLHGGDYKYHSHGEVFKSESDFSIELYITL